MVLGLYHDEANTVGRRTYVETLTLGIMEQNRRFLEEKSKSLVPSRLPKGMQKGSAIIMFLFFFISPDHRPLFDDVLNHAASKHQEFDYSMKKVGQ